MNVTRLNRRHLLQTALAGAALPAVAGARNLRRTLDLDDPNWKARDYRGMRAYSASKIANMLFTLELQRRFEKQGIQTIATAAHPGWTGTNLQQTSTLFRALNPLLSMRPWQGALPTLYAAVAEDAEPGAYYGPDGFMNMRGYPARNEAAAQSRDPDLAARLWQLSEEWSNTAWPLEPVTN